jgi:hypothetical protein
MTKKYFIQLGIAIRVHMAFNRFCDENLHALIEGRPENYSELTEEEQKICLTYYIQDKEKKTLASFHPSGIYKCFEDKFEPIFNKIVEDLHYAAYKANEAQDMLHKRMTEEFERNLQEKSDKSSKFSL